MLPKCLSRCLLLTLLLAAAMHTATAQTQEEQPPANYGGPDTYGLCAYLIGDTVYYGRVFYTSSYFRPKAAAAIRQYAQAQAKGAATQSSCLWAFREADIETKKETDRRLVGLPGHPARFVEVDWTFHGGTVGSAGARQQSTGVAQSPSPATDGQGAARQRTATAGSGYGSAARSVTTTNASSQGSTSTASGSVANGMGTTTTTGSMLGGAQQSMADAKNNAISSAGTGLTTATNTAMGALNNGMQNMFHRHQAQPAAQTQQAAPSSTGGGGVAGRAAEAAPGQGDGFGFSSGGAAVANATTPLSPTGLALEGLIADVSGREVIINVGSQAGLRPGQLLVVMHPQRTVNDPATGRPLRTIEAQVGELRITAVDPGSASGTFTGNGVPVVGDKVRAR